MSLSGSWREAAIMQDEQPFPDARTMEIVVRFIDCWKRLPIYSFHTQKVSSLHICGRKSWGWKQTSIHSLVFMKNSQYQNSNYSKLCYQLLLGLMFTFKIRKVWHRRIIYTTVLPDAVLQAPAIYDDQGWSKMMLSYGKFRSYQKKTFSK